jgi:hypothetical protein
MKSDPYEQMQDMARAISGNMVTAIAFFEVFRPSGQDKHLVKQVNSVGINAGHNAISDALHQGTILTLCRLWDERSDVASIPQAANQLKRSVDAIEEIGHLVDRKLLRPWTDEVKAYNQSEELRALKLARDRAIAHTAAPNREYLGKSRRSVYGDERKVLEMTIPLVERLNRLIGYKWREYAELQRRWNSEANKFWAHVIHSS